MHGSARSGRRGQRTVGLVEAGMIIILHACASGRERVGLYFSHCA